MIPETARPTTGPRASGDNVSGTCLGPPPTSRSTQPKAGDIINFNHI